VNDHTPHLENLAQLAHSDGGWGYVPGQAAHLEPTCLALLALSLESDCYKELIGKGRHALARSAHPDGSYRIERGREEAVWPTALALFVQCVLDLPEEPKRKSAGWLLALRGRTPDDKESEELHDIDLKLVGWPWSQGNFSWTEPTAWACLALRRAGLGEHPRVQEGLKMLLDRAMDEGGINYGNRRILGRMTDPIPGPTALMLLALQGRDDHPRIAAALKYLAGAALQHNDLEHFCWAKLALDAHREKLDVVEQLPALDDRIVEASRQRGETNWVKPAPLREALTALALGASKRNVFRIERPAPLEKVTEPILKQKSRSFGERVSGLFRGMAVKAAGQLRQPPIQNAVHIARVSDYNANLADVLTRQYENYREHVPLKGKRVVLKPNLVEYHRDKVINTDPRVVAAVIELCQREGAAEVIVAEGPGHWRNVEYLVKASGLGDVLRTYKIPFVDLNHDEPVKTPNLGGLTRMEYLYLSRTVASAEVLISLPKLKTHHWAGATLSLKNLFGTMPGICYGWPKNELHWRGIDNSIVDIALTRTPDLAIVDGIVGMEGDGPLNGTAKPMGTLIMGADPLAVDATCCRIMKLQPERIPYMIMGAQKKLGLFQDAQIKQLGETIADVAQPFATLPHFHALYFGRGA
jgi:uncharacterized protein (DUF362 family)